MGQIFNKINFEVIGDFFYNVFIKDFLTKLIILIITLIVWSYTILKNDYTTTLSVPIELTNVEEGKVLKNRPPNSVRAQYRGNGMDFFLLLFQSKSTFYLNLDLSSIEQNYQFNLNEYFNKYPENIKVPRNSGVDLLNIIEPQSLEVEMDDLDQKKVPVNANLDITMPSGYVKYDPEINPDSVQLTGPISYLSNINQVGTDTLKREQVVSTVLAAVDIKKFDQKNIEINPEQVKVYQEIDQIGEKVVSGIPVKIKNKPENRQVEIYPPKVSVYLTGGFEKIKNIDPDDINIVLDFQNELDPQKEYYKPRTNIVKEKVDIREIKPPEIEVRFIEEGNEE